MSRRTYLRLTVGSIALLSTPALAQDEDSAQSTARGGFDQIVVTAQKREETAQSTALSITAITGEEILKKAQGSIDAVIQDAPGVELQGLAQGTQIYIRGVGSSIDPTFADPAIALMVDGAYNGRTEGVEVGAFDIERVEVLRGPQGTLYGRNASGGIINVITADPVLGDVTGYGQVQAGNYSLFRFEGAVNVPLGDRVAVRVAGFRENRDGFLDDGGNDSDSWGVRGKILIEPNDWLRIVAKADVFRGRGYGMNTVPVPWSAGNLGFPPPFMFTNFNPPLAGMTNPPACPDFVPFVGCAPIPRFPDGWVTADASDPWANNAEHVPGLIERDAESYSAEIDADLGFATLTLLPSYTRTRNRLVSNYLFGSILPGPDAAFAGGPAFPTPGGPTFDNSAYGDQESTTRYKSVEARLASNGNGPLKYVVGLYYLDSDPGAVQLPSSGFTTGGDPFTLTNTIQAGETLALFGQATYSITDTLRLTGGLRWSRDKSGQDYGIVIGGADSGTTTYNQSQESTQYKAGFEFDIAEDSLLYGHVSTGFKQGGISPTFPPTEFLPETLTAFELGSKNQFWDNRVQFNAALFHYKYENYQYSTFTNLPIIDQMGAEIGNNTFIVINNAGKTNITGLEVTLDIIPWRNGRFSGSLTYLDATYGDAILPDNPFVGQGDYQLGGTRIQNAPEWAGNIGFEQGFEVGPGILSFNVNTHLSTGYHTTPEQYLPGAYQEGYSRTNAGVRYEADSGWSLGVIVRNIENNAQTTYVFPAYRRFITDPRTVVVTAGYRF